MSKFYVLCWLTCDQSHRIALWMPEHSYPYRLGCHPCGCLVFGNFIWHVCCSNKLRTFDRGLRTRMGSGDPLSTAPTLLGVFRGCCQITLAPERDTACLLPQACVSLTLTLHFVLCRRQRLYNVVLIETAVVKIPPLPLALWPWTSSVTSLCLSFFIWEEAIIIITFS